MLSADTVLVLGAGINGAAIARELLLNRVPVCLVDRWDMASGTTAYSSRLIHGGLRYLEYGEFALVRQSLDERERLLRLAPQFVQPLELCIPLEHRASGALAAARRFLGRPDGATGQHVSRGAWLIRAGLLLYDQFARSSRLPRHRIQPLDSRHGPPVDARRFRWLASYFDAQIRYPERFVIALLEDARQLARQQDVPLEVYTYHTATRSQRQIALHRAQGTQARHAPAARDSAAVTFTPAAIVNATGAWVDQTLAQLHVTTPQLMGGTRGSHFLTYDGRLRDALAGRGIYTEAQDGRPIFLLPFGAWSLAGTTDLPCAASPETVIATDDELAYLLQAVQDVFPHIHLTREDIAVHYCGVRPLPRVSASTPAAITRRHVLHEHNDPHVPILSVVGGKLTTCRALAEEVSAWVLGRLGRSPQTNSQERVMPGGEAYPTTADRVTAVQSQIAHDLQLSLRQVSAVWDLCGTRTASMLAPTAADATDHADDRRSLSGTDLPVRFVRRVLQDEWCCRLTDLVERRLMLLYHPAISRACLADLISLMIQQGLLDAEDGSAELEACVTRLRTHFGREISE